MAQGSQAPCAPHTGYTLPLLSHRPVRLIQLILFLLQKFPELKFKYVEEEQPEEFHPLRLVPGVQLSSRHYWSPQDIQLFTMDSD